MCVVRKIRHLSWKMTCRSGRRTSCGSRCWRWNWRRRPRSELLTKGYASCRSSPRLWNRNCLWLLRLRFMYNASRILFVHRFLKVGASFLVFAGFPFVPVFSATFRSSHFEGCWLFHSTGSPFLKGFTGRRIRFAFKTWGHWRLFSTPWPAFVPVVAPPWRFPT